jgi:hypothetical protein
MKYSIFCFLLLAAACKNSNNDKSLEGIYTASYEHEFGKNTDTLILKKANNGNGVYQITRHTGLIKKMDGKEFPKEVLTNSWVLNYNADTKTLTELREGKTLVWDGNRLTLQLGIRSYKKLSELK